MNDQQRKAILKLNNQESNQLTRECLQTALMQLLQSKSLQSITITELVKKAGVSRTAFYRNYNSKEAILDEFSNDLLNQIYSTMLKGIISDNSRPVFLQFFETLKDQRDNITLLFNSGVISNWVNRIDQYLKQHHPQLTLKNRYFLLGWAGMMQNILLVWYENGTVEGPDEMADFCYQLSRDLAQHNNINVQDLQL